MSAKSNPMTPQLNSVWKRPGLIVLFAVILLVNFVVDWFWFKPENIVVFLIADAAVVAAIAMAASRKLPPGKGDGGTTSSDVANFVP